MTFRLNTIIRQRAIAPKLTPSQRLHAIRERWCGQPVIDIDDIDSCFQVYGDPCDHRPATSLRGRVRHCATCGEKLP